MHASLIALVCTLAATNPAEPRIVSASLFKNGYAMVIRELPVSGESVTTTQIPMVSLGTFWLTASDGVKIREVTTTYVQKEGHTPLSTFRELLAANKGADVEIQTSSLGVVRGKVVDVQGELVVIQADSMRIFNIGQIAQLVFAAPPTLNRPHIDSARALSLGVSGTGKVWLMGLERGLMWTPGYALELLENKKMRLVAKSTVLNDLGDFDQAELRFVTGFPNVPWATLREPLLSGQSVDEFTQFLNNIGGASRDAGFGSRREMMSGNALGQMPGDFNQGFDPSGAPDMMAEDLFFYRQPAMSMKRGDRSMVVLFDVKTDYDQVFRAEMPASLSRMGELMQTPAEMPIDVWNTISFQNNSGHPLTTGALSVFKANQVLGQDTLMYTSAGAKATVRISKALDIHLIGTEREIARERAAYRNEDKVAFDAVTLTGTIRLRNLKSEDVKVEITKLLSGEVVTSTGTPKVEKVVHGLRDLNPTTKLTWSLTAPKGKELTLSYTFKLFTRPY